MRLAITNHNEINALRSVLNEIEDFSEELNTKYFEDVDVNEEDYPILFQFKLHAETIEEFLGLLFRYIRKIHFQRILWNCSTMLDNCANPELDYLDFHPDIKRGLELLAKEEENKPNCFTIT